MSSFNQRYEEVVLQDVRNPKYPRNERTLWYVFAGLFGILGYLYFRYFHSSLPKQWSYIEQCYTASLTSRDPNFRLAVYAFNFTITFALFVGLVGVSGCFALFAFDMQRRNRIIRNLMEASDFANASGKENS